jgi:hypothetical protein
VSLIDSPENGATEYPGSSNNSTFVFLAGPIREWWKPGRWGDRDHLIYSQIRDEVHETLSADFLVFAPHRAWRGPWDVRAQVINDQAISIADIFVQILVYGVSATGTGEEHALAIKRKIPIFTVNVQLHHPDTYRSQLEAIHSQIKEFYHGSDRRTIRQ